VPGHLIAMAKRWGLLWNTQLLLQPDAARHLAEQLAAADAPPCVQTILTQSLNGVHQAIQAEESLHATVTQKGHIYIHCTKRVKRDCSQPFMREELLSEQIREAAGSFARSAEWADCFGNRQGVDRKEGLSQKARFEPHDSRSEPLRRSTRCVATHCRIWTFCPTRTSRVRRERGGCW
jgi:hypothetical protein